MHDLEAHPRPFAARALLLSLSALLGAAGCDSAASEPDVEEVAGAVQVAPAPDAASVAVPFEEFQDDVGSRAATEVRTVIRTAPGYQRYFGHAPPAGVDFPRQWVIFYSAGTKPTGGFDANLLSLARAGRSLSAVTELISPAADCPVTQSPTSPHVLVKLDAQPGAAIQFQRRDQTHDCAVTDPCATVKCAAGTHCATVVVECITTPCPPIAECVPDAAPVTHCGGIAGIPCPGIGRCVDDPSDGCDPQNGGADCGGICQCIQNVACVQGTVFDGSPAVCACVPAPGTVSCGKTVCPDGQLCCNASCGICAPRGAACIQIACDPPA